MRKCYLTYDREEKRRGQPAKTKVGQAWCTGGLEGLVREGDGASRGDQGVAMPRLVGNCANADLPPSTGEALQAFKPRSDG